MIASQHWTSKMMMKPKQPKRPPSAYNIFYAFESKRLKRRENALVRFHTIFSPGKSQPKLNCTQAIGSKWSKGREAKSFVPFFDLVREEKLQEYCTRKELFLAETTFNRFELSHSESLNRIIDDVDGCKLFGTNARNGPYERVRKLVLEALGEEDTRPERIHGERARALLSLELISVLA